MKKYILASLLLIATYLGFAQPYFPVERGKKTYFYTNNGTIYLQLKDSSLTYPTTYTCEKQVLYAPNELPRFWILHQLHTVLGTSFQWYADSQVVFNNYLNKPITLKLNSTINEQWLAYADSNIAVYMKHVNDTVLMIDNTIDSVMNFKCSTQVFRLPPEPASDYGKFIDITMSKNHGIVNAPDFYHFPLLSTESYFIEIGALLFMIRYKTAYFPDVHNITWDSIYRFNVGDEFHTKQLHRYSNPTQGLVFDSLSEIKVVTQAQYKPDTFIYTIRKTTIGKRTTDLGDSIWYEVDTNQVFYYHKNYWDLDTEPGVIHTPTNRLFTVFQSNGTIAKTEVGRINIYYANDSAIATTDDPVIDRPVFIKGCGGPYYQDKSIINHPPSQGITIKELVYYKKGTTTWGTPISKTVGINEVNQPNQLSVYPNPAQNEVFINLKQTGQLNLYNAVGVICLEQPIMGPSKINLSTLKPGLYYYTITTKSKVFNGKLLKE